MNALSDSGDPGALMSHGFPWKGWVSPTSKNYLICGSHHSRRATNSFLLLVPKARTWSLRNDFPVHTFFPFAAVRTLSGPECMVQGQEAGEPVSKQTMSKSSARNMTTNISLPSNRRAQKTPWDVCCERPGSFFHLAHATPELETGRRCCLKGVDTKPSTSITLRLYSDLLAGRMSVRSSGLPNALSYINGSRHLLVQDSFLP
ncbi:hypothetical protein QBC45DRAFT_75839 [Copromyces sp. CBS 386.78]|nr:hypothetical protein QBC45DRAFT_75839 [Copromyces sp. CBS 386.78]